MAAAFQEADLQMQLQMLQALQAAQKLEVERNLLLQQRSKAQAVTSYTQGHILADFDGTAYGPQYLCLARADEVRNFGPSETHPGWSFGERVRDGARGCFPTEYFAVSQASTTATASVASSSQWTQANSPAQVSLAAAAAQSDSPAQVSSAPAAQSDDAGVPAARMSLREMLRALPPPEASSEDAEQGADPDDRAMAQVCSPATTTYGRDFLLSIASAIETEGLHEEDHPVLASMAASTLGRRKRSKKDAATLKSIILLLQAAGGSVRISNLRAACISLSIMTGTHQQVYEDLKELMAAHPQYFDSPSSTSEQLLRDQFVRLCPKLCEEALMDQSMQQGNRPALPLPSEGSIVLQI